MHPEQRAGDQQEERHEAARPEASQVKQQAEQDRQHETAEAADHADESSDRTDMVGIIDRDVLVDRSLAKRHEEAQHEYGDDEADETHLDMEGRRAVDAVDDIVGRRIGQDEGRRDRNQEGPVEHAAGAEAVGEVPAIGAKQARRHREEGCDHAGRLDVEAVDVDEILRQPERERDKRSEHEEIVERETPDLDVL